MLEYQLTKPECWEDADLNDRHYNYVEDGTVIAYFCLNFHYLPYAMVHMVLPKFSHNILKIGKIKVWPAVVAVCREQGAKAILIEAPGSLESTTSYRKFLKHFGFGNIVERIHAIQRI